MDQHLIRYPDTFSKVEFCDLFSPDKHLIHIKRYAGSSAPLSHLFAQALVSASLFRREEGFRAMVNQALPEAFRPGTAVPAAGEYEVVFGVVSESESELILPFFSKINIKNARDRLHELGYKISLTKIQAKRKILKSQVKL
jgi:uncharacterized protein (TIGR04141 family)